MSGKLPRKYIKIDFWEFEGLGSDSSWHANFKSFLLTELKWKLDMKIRITRKATKQSIGDSSIYFKSIFKNNKIEEIMQTCNFEI